MSLDLLLRKIEGFDLLVHPGGVRHMGLEDAQLLAAAKEARELRAEVERLRAERQPFRTVMDAALERGIAEGKCDAAVLELAERFGFRLVDLRDVMLANGTLLLGGVRFQITKFNVMKLESALRNAEVELKLMEVPPVRHRAAEHLAGAGIRVADFDGFTTEYVLGTERDDPEPSEADPIDGEAA